MLLKIKEVVDLVGLLPQVGTSNFSPQNTKLYWREIQNYLNFFFTVEIIESYLQINSQQPIEELSAQHITSCTPNELQCGGNGNFFSDFFFV